MSGMEVHAHVPLMGKTWSHWLLEGTFIIVSVLLAFGVGQIREHRANRETAGHALRSIRDEVTSNLQRLEPMVDWHARWLDAIRGAEAEKSASNSAMDVWFSTRPEFTTGVSTSFPLLRRSAWDAAVNGDVLRLIDYDVSASLSDVYREQEIAVDNVNRLANGPLSVPTTFDPSNRGPSVRLLWLTLADIESAERALLKRYKDALPDIEKAIDRY
jgi:hypothetical protein